MLNLFLFLQVVKVGIVEQSLSTSGKKGDISFRGVVVFSQVNVFYISLFILCMCMYMYFQMSKKKKKQTHFYSVYSWFEALCMKPFFPTICSGLRWCDGRQHKHPVLPNTPIGWSVWERDRGYPSTVSLRVHRPFWSWVRQRTQTELWRAKPHPMSSFSL